MVNRVTEYHFELCWEDDKCPICNSDHIVCMRMTIESGDPVNDRSIFCHDCSDADWASDLFTCFDPVGEKFLNELELGL